MNDDRILKAKISKSPDKIRYNTGETFDTTGMQILVLDSRGACRCTSIHNMDKFNTPLWPFCPVKDNDYSLKMWIIAGGNLIRIELPIIVSNGETIYYASIKVHPGCEGMFSQLFGDTDLNNTVSIKAALNDGYVFSGWYDEDGNLISTENPYVFTLDSDVCYYAVAEVYVPEVYSVSANPFSGQEELFDSVYVEPQLGVSGTECAAYAIVNSGYQFSCWVDLNDLVLSKDQIYTFNIDNSDINIFAKAEEIVDKYIILFNNNGGSGEMPDEYIDKELSEYVLPMSLFTPPDGYEFSCWKINDESYLPGDTILVNNDLIAYAQWKIILPEPLNDYPAIVADGDLDIWFWSEIVDYVYDTFPTLKYGINSKDNLLDWEWVDLKNRRTFNKLHLNDGDCLYIVGNNDDLGNLNRRFVATGKFRMSGDLMYLLNESGTLKTLNCSFQGMFKECTGLITPPQLSALVLNCDHCYELMFYNCVNLERMPDLPALKLSNYCYKNMFNNCIKLTYTTELRAVDLKPSCYELMFYNCTGLKSACNLPADRLEDRCYYRMFDTCINLQDAPTIFASVVAKESCVSMFSDCWSILSFGPLFATDLDTSDLHDSYAKMFYHCTNLKLIEVRFTKWDHLMKPNTYLWVLDVCKTGKFICPQELRRIFDESHIPSGWIVENINDVTYDGKI